MEILDGVIPIAKLVLELATNIKNNVIINFIIKKNVFIKSSGKRAPRIC